MKLTVIICILYMWITLCVLYPCIILNCDKSSQYVLHKSSLNNSCTYITDLQECVFYYNTHCPTMSHIALYGNKCIDISNEMFKLKYTHITIVLLNIFNVLMIR